MSDLVVDGKSIRRDGEMGCLTDLWKASGAPKDRRPVDWLRFAGAPFVEFVQDSVMVGNAHVESVRVDRGGKSPATWGHWQIALAYAKSLSHEFHARVNDVYRAFAAGQLAPTPSEHGELERLTLRIQKLNSADYESMWDLDLKLELARLRKIEGWSGRGREPQGLAHAYGATWRIILGDALFESLRKRNPTPQVGTLHGQWVTEEKSRLMRREDMVITLFIARRATRWTEYVNEMRAHFGRTPIQLRLAPAPIRSARSLRASNV